MPEVSVVVPIFNSENTLFHCINTILSQTIVDFELILVNDGSSDSSLEICNNFAKQDTRVIVINKPNGGVSSARNAGIDNAVGRWILFVDSDDWVDDRFIEALLEKSGGVDLVIGSAVYVNHPCKSAGEQIEAQINGDEYCRLFSDFSLSKRTAPWNKLFKRQIIEDYKIRFPLNVNMGEDAVFVYTYLLYSNRVQLIESRHYYYLYDSVNSLTKRINPVQNECNSLKAIEDSIRKLITKRDIKDTAALLELDTLKANYIHRVLNALYYYPSSRKERIELIGRLDIATYCCSYQADCNWAYSALLRRSLIKERYVLYDIIRRVVKLIKYRR